jgi:hypothetical protein
MDNDNEIMIHRFMEEEANCRQQRRGEYVSSDGFVEIASGGGRRSNTWRFIGWAKKTKPRQRLEGHLMLHNDYFAAHPTYNAKDFAVDIDEQGTIQENSA